MNRCRLVTRYTKVLQTNESKQTLNVSTYFYHNRYHIPTCMMTEKDLSFFLLSLCLECVLYNVSERITGRMPPVRLSLLLSNHYPVERAGCILWVTDGQKEKTSSRHSFHWSCSSWTNSTNTTCWCAICHRLLIRLCQYCVINFKISSALWPSYTQCMWKKSNLGFFKEKTLFVP